MSYEKIKVGSVSMPAVDAPGETTAEKAEGRGYQDLYLNIQAEREADFAEEEKDGQITSEFSGLFGDAKSRVEVLKHVVYFGLTFFAGYHMGIRAKKKK